MYYSECFVVSGGIFEYYKYDRPISTVRQNNSGGRKKGENSQKYREDTYQKSKKEVRRLINCNLNEWTDEEENRIMSKFLTITYKENVTDLDTSNREFSKFMRRLNARVYGDKKSYLKYLAVIEFQKRGAVHYHVVMFNLPYMPVKEIEKIWGLGFVKINKIDNCDNVGAYVCKYMTKSDDERLQGRRMFLKSSGLLEPERIVDFDQVEMWKNLFACDGPTYETEFEAPFIGKIKYEQYNRNKTRKVVK